MRVVVILLAFVVSKSAFTQDLDTDALSFADHAVATTKAARSWQLHAEGGALFVREKSDDADALERAALDFRLDQGFAEKWRVMMADRVDWILPMHASDPNPINTLKELYIGYQPLASSVIGLGRINARYGVAIGYNPTDFFRSEAIRFIASANPASLRENRQGSIMTRSQFFWTGGSADVIYSPRLSQERGTSGFDHGIGFTNNRNRALLSVTQRVFEHFSPQVVIFDDDEGLKYGVNATGVVGSATVMYLEGSAGKSRTLQAAGDESAEEKWQSKIATGLTYTFPSRLSLTFEYDRYSGALSAAVLRELYSQSPAEYGRYRQAAATRQELATRENLFLYAAWPDFLRMKNLDLSAFVRADTGDHSYQNWIEISYKFEASDLSFSWQRNAGAADTEFGVINDRETWMLVFRYFL